MLQVSIRCYAELNDFLPMEKRFVTSSISLLSNTRIEELANKIGISPNVIDLVLANGTSVSMMYLLEENDRIALYPVFESFDISSITEVRNHPLRQPRFVLDVHLRKLTNHLRMFGFDALYRNNYTNEILIALSINEHRILLSKDRSLLETESLLHAYNVKNKDPRLQLIEVLERFDLYNLVALFTRCIECNTILQNFDKHAVLSPIPPKVKEWCTKYQWCSFCDRIYWEGSHYLHMQEFIQSVLRR
jgi:uncharacterized protein with PIN domain